MNSEETFLPFAKTQNTVFFMPGTSFSASWSEAGVCGSHYEASELLAQRTAGLASGLGSMSRNAVSALDCSTQVWAQGS